MSETPLFPGFTVTTYEEPRFVLLSPGDHAALDMLVAVALMAGYCVEAHKPGGRYILSDPTGGKLRESLATFADRVTALPAAQQAGVTILRETAPEVPRLSSRPVPARPQPRRITELQGNSGFINHAVRRAVDFGLTPSFQGAGRWHIVGPSARQMAWAAEEVLKSTVDDAMQRLGVTKGMVAREDLDGMPVAVDSLPRMSTTAIQFDDDGNAIASKTVEAAIDGA